MPERIEREMGLDASPAEVWHALTDSSQLSEWFGAEVEIEPRRGGRVRVRFTDGRERGAVVEALDRERLLILRWLPFERRSNGTTVARPSTNVRFSLEPRGSRTMLVVHETLPGPSPGDAWIRGRADPSPREGRRSEPRARVRT